MKFPLLQVSAAPFFQAGARLFLLLPPSLVPRDAMPRQDGGDGRHKAHRPCTEQALGIPLPPYPCRSRSHYAGNQGHPKPQPPPSLLFPPPPASCPEQGTLPPPWHPRHPQAPTPLAATRRANGSTETRGRPSAKRKPPRAAAGGAPQPSPRAGLQHRDTLPAPQGPPGPPSTLWCHEGLCRARTAQGCLQEPM